MHLKTLGFSEHNVDAWEIIFHDEVVPEYRKFPGEVQIELVALLVNLRERGPLLGEPLVDRFYRELIRAADERFERYLKAPRLQKGC